MTSPFSSHALQLMINRFVTFDYLNIANINTYKKCLNFFVERSVHSRPQIRAFETLTDAKTRKPYHKNRVAIGKYQTFTQSSPDFTLSSLRFKTLINISNHSKMIHFLYWHRLTYQWWASGLMTFVSSSRLEVYFPVESAIDSTVRNA